MALPEICLFTFSSTVKIHCHFIFLPLTVHISSNLHFRKKQKKHLNRVVEEGANGWIIAHQNRSHCMTVIQFKRPEPKLSQGCNQRIWGPKKKLFSVKKILPHHSFHSPNSYANPPPPPPPIWPYLYLNSNDKIHMNSN